MLVSFLNTGFSKENQSLRSKLPKPKSANTVGVQTPNEWMSRAETSRIAEVSFRQPADRPRQNYGMRPKSQYKMINTGTNTDFATFGADNETKRVLKRVSPNNLSNC